MPMSPIAKKPKGRREMGAELTPPSIKGKNKRIFVLASRG